MVEKTITIPITVGDELINAEVLLQEREDDVLYVRAAVKYKGKDYALADSLKEPSPRQFIWALENMEFAVKKCITKLDKTLVGAGQWRRVKVVKRAKENILP